MAAAWARRRGGVGGGLVVRVGRDGGGATVVRVFGLELVAELRQSRGAPWPVRPALGAGLRHSLRIAQLLAVVPIRPAALQDPLSLEQHMMLCCALMELRLLEHSWEQLLRHFGTSD